MNLMSLHQGTCEPGEVAQSRPNERPLLEVEMEDDDDEDVVKKAKTRVM